jgi:hypothetical protein
LCGICRGVIHEPDINVFLPLLMPRPLSKWHMPLSTKIVY